MIRLLLADDQALVRGALAALLDLESDLEVVAPVGRGDEVVDAARASGAEVCLLDIEMPGADGIEVAGRLAREVPGCRSLIVTTFGGLAMLVGIVMLSWASGTYRVSEILADPPEPGFIVSAAVAAVRAPRRAEPTVPAPGVPEMVAAVGAAAAAPCTVAVKAVLSS